MTVAAGPDVAEYGLVLSLDAANGKSYPGSGTTWTDLSGNNNTGTLTNGLTYSSNNGGAIVFDGTNDFVTLPYLFFSHDAGTPFSVSIWFKTATSGILLGQTNGSGGYVPAIYTDTNGKIRTSCFWGDSNLNQSVSTATVTDNIWHNITVTFASTSHKSYLDGILYETISKTQISYGNNYNYYIGNGSWTSWINIGANVYFTGSVGNFNFWTRELSSAEVIQNHNAYRGRFGL